MEGAGAPKIPGADKRQHSVSFKTIVITVYPEVFWRAGAFRLIGFGSFATFCTFGRGLSSYQLSLFVYCLSDGMFLHPIDNNNGNNDNQDNANENNDRKKTKQRQ